MNLKKILPHAQTNILLENHTTFRIGGKAKYFIEALSKEDLVFILEKAKELKIKFFVLGGGSKMLVSDKGFNGLVIKTKNSSYKIDKNKIYAESGLPLEKLVNLSLKKGLKGLEWAAGIPGMVGGAVRGNAGAWEKSIEDVIEKVEIFDFSKKKIKVFNNKQCRFGYRNSVFKRNKDLIILSCQIKLSKGNKKEIGKKIEEYIAYRKKNHPVEFPSAGSVFENVFVVKKGGKEKIPTGKIIAECGLAGKRIGNVKISEKHSNFIVNLGKGKEKDVKKLIKLAKEKAKKKFNINLKEELQHLN